MNIYEIQLSRQSLQSLNLLRAKFSKAVYNREVKRLQTTMTALGLGARDAFRSKVPIDTGQLRNKGIQVKFASDNLSCVVEVEEINYINSRGARVQAAALSLILDAGFGKGGNRLRRTRNSFAVTPYTSIGYGSPTAGWITSAKRAFGQTRRRIINGK